MKKQIVIFAREPELGKCKTRLADGIGIIEAHTAYQKMLKTLALNVSSLGVDIHIAFHSPTAEPSFLQTTFPFAASWIPQVTGSLGEKLQQALQPICKNKKTLVIGSDSPDIPKSFFEEAFLALDSKDFCLGSTEDGGYYLLGLKEFHPELFQNISWSSEIVFQQTLDAMQRLGSAHQLSHWYDIDTKTEYTRFIQSN